MRPAWGKKAAAQAAQTFEKRTLIVVGIFLFLLCGVIARLVQLHIFHKDFLRAQGNARAVHIVKTPSYRGMLLDRNHEPLAISTPVDAVWVDPRRFDHTTKQLGNLAQLIEVPVEQIQKKIAQYPTKAFLYLKRGLPPETANAVRALKVRGLYVQREYRRYYPSGKDASQLIGFTNIDDEGQAGLEALFNEELSPIPGKKRVLEDRIGHWIEDLENIQTAHSGQNIVLSIDARIQALMLRELEQVLENTQAKSASAVMVDVRTGEVLGIVTAPSFNPNLTEARQGSMVRLRAITDPIEPGSTIKPFTLCAALEYGGFTPETQIDTNPGRFKLGDHTIKDVRNYGVVTVSEILTKSSNIGISKIALAMSPYDIINTFSDFSLGTTTLMGLPGESSGQLDYNPENSTLHASFGYGYGLSITPLQLVHAYATLASGGIDRPLSIFKIDSKNSPKGLRVISEKTAKTILNILGEVTQGSGTGRRARIPGYHTAGKTGTSRLVGPNGYDENRHLSLFAGVTPLNAPRLATVIVVEEPQNGYYGGLIAAPVYAKIVGSALHMLNAPPDWEENPKKG